MQLRDRVN